MTEPLPDSPISALGPSPSTSVVFTADFTSTAQWVAGRSWAYPGGGPVNPRDDKLDYLVPDGAYSRSGVLRARRRPDDRWNTGLLTTEGSQEGFTVRAGDVLGAASEGGRRLAGDLDLAGRRPGDRCLRVPPGQPGPPRIHQPCAPREPLPPRRGGPTGRMGGPPHRFRLPIGGLVAQRQARLRRRTRRGPHLGAPTSSSTSLYAPGVTTRYPSRKRPRCPMR